MKKFTKCVLRLAAISAATGAAFTYLKKKGIISVTNDSEDEDYDDFSCPDYDCSQRSYVNVDTTPIKEKAKEVAQEVKTKASEFVEKAQDTAEDIKDELMEKAEDAYDEAKKKVETAKETISSTVKKVSDEAKEKFETVEEFFNDED